MIDENQPNQHIMSLQVIGAGVGRTGTESLKLALEQLGFGKCYHMFELMKNPNHLVEWKKLEAGQLPDYGKLFAGYSSSVDFPACIYYKEFLEQYPDAKVILTVRNADQWFDSASKTIFRPIPGFLLGFLKIMGIFFHKAKAFPLGYDYAKRIVHQHFFDGKTTDREHCVAVYQAWNEEVKRNVPADKLLVFEVKQGWEPLCRFLNVPVPQNPFPQANKGESFLKNISKKIFSSGK